MKHHCPMCGEQWNDDKCSSCGWFEGKQPRHHALDMIVDKVLAYRPKAKSKPAVRRKREANKIAKEKPHEGT